MSDSDSNDDCQIIDGDVLHEDSLSDTITYTPVIPNISSNAPSIQLSNPSSNEQSNDSNPPKPKTWLLDEHPCIHKSSKEVLTKLKKKYRPIKHDFDIVGKNKRFPFVLLTKVEDLEQKVREYVREVKEKKVSEVSLKQINEENDNLIHDYEDEDDDDGDGDEYNDESDDSGEDIKPRKKQAAKHNDEDYDFDEDVRHKEKKMKASSSKSFKGCIIYPEREAKSYVPKSQKLTAFKDKVSRLSKHVKKQSAKEGLKCVSKPAVEKKLKLEPFKIPKKEEITSENLFEHVGKLIVGSRFDEAFNLLEEHLEEYRWYNEDTIELLAKILLGLAGNIKLERSVLRAQEIAQKIVNANYLDNKFWENFIHELEKPIKFYHCVDDVKMLMATLYEFINDNEIRLPLYYHQQVLLAYYYSQYGRKQTH